MKTEVFIKGRRFLKIGERKGTDKNATLFEFLPEYHEPMPFVNTPSPVFSFEGTNSQPEKNKKKKHTLEDKQQSIYLNAKKEYLILLLKSKVYKIGDKKVQDCKIGVLLNEFKKIYGEDYDTFLEKDVQ